MIRRFTNLNVSAITAALPETGIDRETFAALFGEKEVARIMESTGIEAVRIAGALTVGDLCEAAARHVMTAMEQPAHSIDAIVVVTQTPDDLMPGVAVKLHDRLGLREDCLAFDLNYGCSGFIYGLTQAALLIQGGGCRTVLVCTGDVTSKLLHPDDRHVRLVFGDAASASLVTASPGTLDVVIRTDGGGRSSLNTPLNYGRDGSGPALGYLAMAGNEVMNFALSKVPALIRELMTHTALELADVDVLVLHQANRFMLNYLRKIIGIAPERVPVDVVDTGNTGPSSIPLLLARSNVTHPRQWSNAIVCGFGVGLSWGAIRLDLSNTRFIRPVDVPTPQQAVDPTPQKQEIAM